MRIFSRKLVATVACALVAGCGGGGGGGSAPQPRPNQPPTANAGGDQIVTENTVVTLSGSGRDPESSALTYAWTQIAGARVTIDPADQAQVTFTAPEVTTDEILSFRLTVTDDRGATGTDVIDVTVTDTPPAVTLSGRAQFEFVPRNPITGGLDYSAIEIRPIRGATVQAIAAADGRVLDTTVSGESGRYTLAVPSNTDVFVRVRAELKRNGTPFWNVEVRDNTSNTGLPVSQRPLYVLDTVAANTGDADSSRNLVAATGWGGTSYTGPRSAAPFSVLDVIYEAIQLVLAADPDARFPPLDAFWSVNNRPVDGDEDIGEIRTSFYRSDIDALFLLGYEDEDTEEFDTHVIAHEWGHYFEDTFSRSDSVGGVWGLRQRLDPRLAFGEGWGDAVAGMIMGDPVYFDTFGQQQSGSFAFSVDDNDLPVRGWYTAGSVQAILWDLFDAAPDGADQVSLGFAPLYDLLVNEQRSTSAYTTVFSFISELKARNPLQAGAIDQLVGDQNIGPIVDIWGAGEANDPGQSLASPVALTPVFTELTLGAGPVNVCVTKGFDRGADGNKLGISRYVRFTIPSAGDYRISAVATNPPADPAYSDPDFAIVRDGVILAIGGSGTQNSEELQLSGLTAGVYIVDILEAAFPNFFDLVSASPAFPQTTMCFDVSLTQI